MIRHCFEQIKRLWREYWARRAIKAKIRRAGKEITENRLHQVFWYGHTAKADDCYISRQLKYAAMALAFDCDYMWPWGKERYNGGRHSERERLIKAAALIMAEIDRVDRLIGGTHESRQPI